MANYTFTTSTSYALKTHEVTFTSTKIRIKLTSTGQIVYEKSFSSGLAFMCQNDDFCVGTLTDNGTFNKTVDFGNRNAKLWVEEQSGKNKCIGSDNESDTGIYHKYDLNQCPVRLKSSNNVVTIECPCQSESGPCDHNCYTYG